MKLSTKGRYAVTALADIALNRAEWPVALEAVAERQRISLAYLEQLFVKLRRAGLVESVRGPGGGYRLALEPDRIRVSDIMTAVDERLNAMGCDGKYEEGRGCGHSHEACLTHAVWERLSAHVHVLLSRTTIEDVISGRMAPCPAVPDFTGFMEDGPGASLRGNAASGASAASGGVR